MSPATTRTSTAARPVTRGRGVVLGSLRRARRMTCGREPAGRRRSGSGLVIGGTSAGASAEVRRSGGEPREGRAAGVAGGLVQLLLDTEQLVVLRDALGAGGGTGLDL